MVTERMNLHDINPIFRDKLTFRLSRLYTQRLAKIGTATTPASSRSSEIMMQVWDHVNRPMPGGFFVVHRLRAAVGGHQGLTQRNLRMSWARISTPTMLVGSLSRPAS